MTNINSKDLLKLVTENNISFVKYLFLDINGRLKSAEVSAKHLPDIQNIDYKIMFDGSSVKGYGKITKSDVYLIPDINTFIVEPKLNENDLNIASVICNVTALDLTAHPVCGRTLLQNALSKLKEQNIGKVNLAFEPEFFIFKKECYEKNKLSPIDEAEYFDSNNHNLGIDICREVGQVIEKTNGMTIEKMSHEVAHGQFEINYKYTDALTACDNFIRFKNIVKMIAKKHGCLATFMPKPINKQNGSGLHTNLSLSSIDNKNLFSGDEKSLSIKGQNFLAGALKHSCEIALLTNSCVNSYQRLVKGFEAPVYVAYSNHNRTTLARIPSTIGNSARIEFRNVDASGNPYYAIAGLLLSGLEGIEKEYLSDNLKITQNMFEISEEELKNKNVVSLPENLGEAIDNFKNSPFIKNVFSQEFIDKLLDIKTKEWYEYCHHVTEWHIQKYLGL